MILALTFLRFWRWCKTHSQSELQRQKLAKTFLNRESYGEMIWYFVLTLIFEKSLATNCTTGGSNDQYRSLYIFNCDSTGNFIIIIIIICKLKNNFYNSGTIFRITHQSITFNHTNHVGWFKKKPEPNKYIAHKL